MDLKETGKLAGMCGLLGILIGANEFKILSIGLGRFDEVGTWGIWIAALASIVFGALILTHAWRKPGWVWRATLVIAPFVAAFGHVTGAMHLNGDVPSFDLALRMQLQGAFLLFESFAAVLALGFSSALEA